MNGSSGSGRWVDALWLVAFGVVSSVWCVTSAARVGPTFDEPHHLNGGLVGWRTGCNKILMKAGCMPLPVDVQTLPIYVWERVRGVPFDQVGDMETILPVARAANLAFWWLLLVYAMKLGRTFGGRWGGRLAVALAAIDPNFLGHAALATTDISVVACVLAFVYHFHHGRDGGPVRRVLVPGVWFGLATIAKVSGMIFGVQAMLALGLLHLARTGVLAPPADATARGTLAHLWAVTFGLRKDIVAVGLLGMVVVFGYCGSDWQPEPTFVKWADKLPDGTLKTVMTPVSRQLSIFPNAGEAIAQQVKHNMRGHGTYLLGEWHHRATWKYFPVVLTMKTPLPMLALLAAVLLVRPRALLSPPGVVALVLLAFSLNYRVQIGVRFMFTFVALGYVALAVAVARGWADGGPGGRYVPRWVVAALLAVQAGTTAWAWPDGLSYFNQAWGGYAAGPELLHDSNTDWGQGLPALRDWHAKHGEPPTAVWYYGADPSSARPPLERVMLNYLPIRSEADLRAAVGRRYLAASATMLASNPDATPANRVATDFLRTQTPVARTGQFVIYDLR